MNACRQAGSARFWFWLGVALILLKLWLVSSQTIYAIGAAGHDDALFLRLASALLQGDWLGTYDQMTLAKGSMYAIWIAAVFVAGVPLFTAQHILYAAMCALLVRAFSPIVARRWLLLAIFAVLLFNPVTYDSLVHARIIRLNLYHSATLGVLSGIVGLIARRQWPTRLQVGWAALLGVSLAVFWLTREEGVWILPLLIPLWGYLLWAIWSESGFSKPHRLVVAVLPAVIWLGGVGLVCGLNYQHYGIATTVEFKARDFQDAYGALCRVTPPHPKASVPVTRETRALVYAVSPAFAELRPYLEGDLGRAWAGASVSRTDEPAVNLEIAAGWFMWALRDAVAAAGHCKSGHAAMAFYRRMAEEVNQACDAGKIPAGPRRSGFAPPLGEIFSRPVLEHSLRAGKFLLTLDGLHLDPVPSTGPAELLVPYADLTRGRLTPMEGAAPIPPKQRWLDKVRLAALKAVAGLYVRVIPVTAVFAACAWLAASVVAGLKGRLPFYCALNLGLVASTAAMTAINGIIDALSFPSIATGAFTACYPLYFLFLFTAPLQLLEVWGAAQKRPSGSQPETVPAGP